MFRLSTRAGETIVFSCKWSHKSVTEIIKEIISPVRCGTNRSFKRQLKKKTYIFDDRSLNQGFRDVPFAIHCSFNFFLPWKVPSSVGDDESVM